MASDGREVFRFFFLLLWYKNMLHLDIVVGNNDEAIFSEFRRLVLLDLNFVLTERDFKFTLRIIIYFLLSSFHELS